jgi:hypothetical protein
MFTNEQQLKFEEDEMSLPAHVDKPVIGSLDVKSEDDSTVQEFQKIKDSQQDGSPSKTGAIIVAHADAVFGSDTHVRTITLDEILSTFVDDAVILLSADQLDLLIQLAACTHQKLCLAETENTPDRKFQFMSRDLKLTSMANLPLKNVAKEKSSIKGLRDIAETPIDGLPNVTKSDVEDALEKIRVVGSAPAKLWKI